MRRDFRLPEEDEQYLDSLGLSWETVKDGETRWLVVHDRPVPPGYNLSNALAGLILPASYPDGPIDMAYFHPHLSLVGGKAINGLTSRAFDGKEWQQWSRHRTAENPWRPGEDCISTHFIQVDHWLLRELPGAAA
jgi:hypothetical protein